MRRKKYKKKNDKTKSFSARINENFNRTVNKIADSLPDWLVGSREVMHQKYTSVYGIGNSKELITNARRKTGKMFIIIGVLVLLVIIMFIVQTFSDTDSSFNLNRSPYEGERKVISAEIEAEYGGEKEKKSADITVLPKGLSEKEKLNRLEKTKKNLPNIILGENKSLGNITSNLNLITIDPETGVEVAWRSEKEEILNDDGTVNPLVARENESVVLDADIRIEETIDHIRFNVSFGKPASGEELTNAINASISNMIKNLSESNNGEKLKLPEKTPEGVKIKWKKKENTGTVTQIAILMLLAVCVYYSRYSFLNKKIKETKESVTRDFPDFINKLVLLLNAGMVVTAAFEKITNDYRNRSIQNQKKYLYEEFCTMEDNINMANSGFLEELNDISQRSGIRDVMRFNTIIIDNIDKGSALVEKLQSESQILWTGRIKMAEEKGRLAETKLTFPMVLQLLVLIIITIAPAAMEM